MIFKSKRDYTFPVIIAFVFILYSIIATVEICSSGDYTILIGLGSVFLFIVLLFWAIQKYTYLEISNEELICHTLFYKKRIPLKTIRKVEKLKGLYAGLKFSTSIFGLVVYYNKFDDVFISPADEVVFMDEIQRRIST